MSTGDFPPVPPSYGSQQPVDKGPPTKDNLTMAMLAHLLGALFGIVGALIGWLIKKDDHPFIDDQGKEAVNFQLTLLIAQLVLIVPDILSCGLLSFLHLVPWLLGLILGIVAATKANSGEWYRYPMTIRFIK